MKPEVIESMTNRLGEVAAAELAIAFDFLAPGFKKYPDPVADNLDSDAYKRIRTCFHTSHPMTKLALRVSNYELRVVGEGKRAEQVQEIIDQIPHLSTSIRSLCWAVIEGVRFAWLTTKPMGGWQVPILHGRKKVKAGGVVEWDGQNIVQQSRLNSGVDEPESQLKSQKWERSRAVVFQPSFDANPEGDTDLAWQLYLLAEAGQELWKNIKYYTNRYGAPWEIFKKAVEKARVADLRSASNTAKDKLASLPHQGVMMSASDSLGLIEPSGATWGFLIQADQMVAKWAHKLILQNVLTSDTADAGPTGSSNVQAGEEDRAVEAVADALGEALNADLLPFIELHNAAILAPLAAGEKALRLELQAVTPPKPDPTPYEALALFHTGVEVEASWLYGIFGAPKPAGVPETLVYVPPAPTQGGAANETADMPAEAKAFLAARPGLIRLAAAPKEVVDPREAFVQMNVESVAYGVEEMISSLVSGYDPAAGEALDYPVSRVAEQAHQHGAISLRLEVNKLPHRAKLSSREPLIKLRDAETEALAARYRAMAHRITVAATSYLREAVHKKLVEFIKTGGAANDAKKFVAWMIAQQPTFTKSYAELVLRNAVNTAYSAGRLGEFRQTAPLLGLNWQYLTANDERVRPLHAEYHALVFPAGPEWERFMPPNGHNCRCTWIVVDSAEHAASEGLDKLPEPEWNYAPDSGPF